MQSCIDKGMDYMRAIIYGGEQRRAEESGRSEDRADVIRA